MTNDTKGAGRRPSFVVRQGDLFASTDLDGLGHGVNCMGVMGSGIAVQFKKRWPAMYDTYKYLCQGRFLTPGLSFHVFDVASGRWIYNLATQDGYGKREHGGADAKLEWIEESVERMLEHAGSEGLARVGIPWIGCGLGGLTKDEVRATLESAASKSTVQLIVHEV